MYKKILLSILLICIIALPAFATDNKILSVNGEATYLAKPDLVKVFFQVECQANTLNEVQQQNNDIMKKFNQAMLKQGITKSEIQTTSFQVTPIQEYKKNSNKSKITGYKTTQQIMLTTDKTDKVGIILAEGMEAGVTKIQKVNYSLKSPDTAKEKALFLAVSQARNKAKVMAQAAGTTLKGVYRINENSAYVTMPNANMMYAARNFDGGMAMEKSAAPVEVSAMEWIEIKATVSIEYLL